MMMMHLIKLYDTHAKLFPYKDVDCKDTFGYGTDFNKILELWNFDNKIQVNYKNLFSKQLVEVAANMSHYPQIFLDHSVSPLLKIIECFQKVGYKITNVDGKLYQFDLVKFRPQP